MLSLVLQMPWDLKVDFPLDTRCFYLYDDRNDTYVLRITGALNRNTKDFCKKMGPIIELG